MSDIEFVDGLIAKAPADAAPEYVKAKISIKREELIAWLQQKDGEWINAEIKEARSGKWYVAVDDWKPEQGARRQPSGPPPRRAEAPPRRSAPPPAQQQAGPFDDDIPF